ncbi:hypothetical protein QVD17_00093 [Tagetes erecta]|uniref:Uncharacterized protein n=1 Tax=Tagetes erecta TaxID=13708 RepID=A0AAD8L2P6_TARER|nr:hypothetical protein QVD17_00093 [Tagetes erecta]
MMSCSSLIYKRKHVSTSLKGRINSDCRVQSSELENRIVTEENDASNMTEIYPDLISNEEPETPAKSRSKDIKKELIALSLPALAGQAIEPMAQLMETAYIGRLVTVMWY